MTSQSIRQPPVSVASQLLRLTTASTAVMLLAAATLHLLRYRLTEFAEPVRYVGWLAAILFVGTVGVVRYARLKSRGSTPVKAARGVWFLSSLAMFVWAWVMTVIAKSFVDVAAVWLVFLTSEFCWWLLLLRSTHNVSAELNASRTAIDPRAFVDALIESDDSELGADLDNSIVQQLTRTETEEHGELIHGIVRCRFSAGERTQVQHVAFCPPLESQPSILADQIEGPAAKVRVAQAESFGARFEIRLDRVCRRPADFVFEFFANAGEFTEH